MNPITASFAAVTFLMAMVTTTPFADTVIFDQWAESVSDARETYHEEYKAFSQIKSA